MDDCLSMETNSCLISRIYIQSLKIVIRESQKNGQEVITMLLLNCDLNIA